MSKKTPPTTVLCSAGKHELGHPDLPCEACAEAGAAAQLRPVTLSVEEVGQVQAALVGVRQLLELAKAPLVGLTSSRELPVEKVLRSAQSAEKLLTDALLASLKTPEET